MSTASRGGHGESLQVWVRSLLECCLGCTYLNTLSHLEKFNASLTDSPTPSTWCRSTVEVGIELAGKTIKSHQISLASF